MMRIAIFTDTYFPEINGVAKTLDRLTKYFNKEGISYVVLAPEISSAIPFSPQVKRFSSMPFLLYPECRLVFPNPLKMKKILYGFQPTLLHIATPFNLGWAGIKYGQKHHIPMVASYDTHVDQYLQYYRLPFLDKWFWSYMRWFHRPFQKVYVPSESTKRKVQQQLHSNIEIWGRGVDYHFFTPEKRSNEVREKYNIKEKNIVLYVGRISPEKDIELVLEAFHYLPADLRNNTHLLMVGAGPLYESLSTEYSSDLEQYKNITFTGFVEGESLAQIYAAADIFFFPSATETFGNVVLEAQSSGLPVIAAKAGGVEQLISNGETGLLCAPHDVASFRAALISLLINPSQRTVLGQQARQSTLSKSWDSILGNLVTSYAEAERLSHPLRHIG